MFYLENVATLLSNCGLYFFIVWLLNSPSLTSETVLFPPRAPLYAPPFLFYHSSCIFAHLLPADLVVVVQ